MTINIPLPTDLEQKLRADTPDLDATAKEALPISLYRQGKLFPKQLQTLLGVDRWQLEVVLKNHNVTEDLPNIEEIREQVDLSEALRKTR